MGRITFLSLFPTEMAQYFQKGILGRAQDKGLVHYQFVNIRDYAEGPHKKVDDYPFGNKHGMLIRFDVLHRAISDVPDYDKATIIYTCPKGPHFNQSHAHSLADTMRSEEEGRANIIFICGYYEGIDERLFEAFKIQRYSMGDFVLSSGETPAMMMAEAILRLLPGIVGKSASVEKDSIISGRLEHPQYTQPRESIGQDVPEVLLSGNHDKRLSWEREQSLRLTLFKKPDLFVKQPCSKTEKDIVRELLKEH